MNYSGLGITPFEKCRVTEIFVKGEFNFRSSAFFFEAIPFAKIQFFLVFPSSQCLKQHLLDLNPHNLVTKQYFYHKPI